MGRPRKIKPQETARVMNDEGQIQEVTEVGVPGLFQPQDWDVQEEVSDMDSFREYQRDRETF